MLRSNSKSLGNHVVSPEEETEQEKDISILKKIPLVVADVWQQHSRTWGMHCLCRQCYCMHVWLSIVVKIIFSSNAWLFQNTYSRQILLFKRPWSQSCVVENELTVRRIGE